MLERIRVTKNAKFYRYETQIDDEIVTKIINTASANKKKGSDFLVHERRVSSELPGEGVEYKYSAIVFPTARPIYFLSGDIETDNEDATPIPEDTIHALLLIIEIKDHLVLITKSCQSLSEITDKKLNLVSSSEFSSSLSDDEVEFQRLSVRNMTVSDRAMRAKSYEAQNLNGLLSTHAAGRSIPYHLKIRHSGVTKSISGSGRITESSERVIISDAAKWASEQIDIINSPSKTNFLNAFARKVELKDVIKSCSPNAILIESNSLFDQIIRDGLVIKYKSKKGRSIRISDRVFKKLESALETVYEIGIDLVIKCPQGNARINENKNTLTISVAILEKFRIFEKSKEYTLQRYIVKNDLYSITFTDAKYMYFMGACFEDKSGISEIDSILEILHPMHEMKLTRSEKGSFKKGQKNFSQKSVFTLVERKHSRDSYILCDDLGDEWADHITINKKNSTINFIHSKYGTQSKSASNLHDVVGQAIKNLGNMYFDENSIKLKIENKLRLDYKPPKVNHTLIKRIRKGSEVDIMLDISEMLKDYKVNRACILACSFISKEQISSEFQRIKNGQSVKGNITQLLWIISSFAHASRDMNVRPIIYCTP